MIRGRRVSLIDIRRKLTSRLVVTDSVPRSHAKYGTGGTLDCGTANLLRILPDKLCEMTKVAQRHVGGGIGHAIERVVAVDLAVVPLVSNSLGCGLELQAINVAGGTLTSEVLAVATSALLPNKRVNILFVHRALISTPNGTYMSCAKTQLLAVFAAYWARVSSHARAAAEWFLR